MKKTSLIFMLLALLGLSVSCSDRGENRGSGAMNEVEHEMDEAGDRMEDAGEELTD